MQPPLFLFLFLFLSPIPLAHSAALIPTALPSLALAPRAQYCANSPTTVAGTHLPARSLPRSLSRRAPNSNSIFWCAPGTSTYILLTLTTTLVPESGILTLLRDAHADLVNHIYYMGDGLVLGGSFTFFGPDNTMLRVRDDANHQATFGVLGAAMLAVLDYMTSQGHFGGGGFVIWDGANRVAKGWLGLRGGDGGF